MRGQAFLVLVTKRKERKEELESWQRGECDGEYDEAWVVALWTFRYTEKRIGGVC